MVTVRIRTPETYPSPAIPIPHVRLRLDFMEEMVSSGNVAVRPIQLSWLRRACLLNGLPMGLRCGVAHGYHERMHTVPVSAGLVCPECLR